MGALYECAPSWRRRARRSGTGLAKSYRAPLQAALDALTIQIEQPAGAALGPAMAAFFDAAAHLANNCYLLQVLQNLAQPRGAPCCRYSNTRCRPVGKCCSAVRQCSTGLQAAMPGSRPTGGGLVARPGNPTGRAIQTGGMPAQHEPCWCKAAHQSGQSHILSAGESRQPNNDSMRQRNRMHTTTTDITPFAAGYRWDEARHHLLYVAVISLAIGGVFGLIYGYWIANLLGSLLTGIAPTPVWSSAGCWFGPPRRALAAVIVLGPSAQWRADAGDPVVRPQACAGVLHQPGIRRAPAGAGGGDEYRHRAATVPACAFCGRQPGGGGRTPETGRKPAATAGGTGEIAAGANQPHFLFNTLANVQSLIDSQPAKAQAMLAHPQQLPAPRWRTRASDDDSNIGRGLELLRHYLMILQFRVGERLQFSIGATRNCCKCRWHDALQRWWKRFSVTASNPASMAGRLPSARDAGQIRMWVADSGLGIQSQTGGSGVGLANVRQRLHSLYGPEIFATAGTTRRMALWRKFACRNARQHETRPRSRR